MSKNPNQRSSVKAQKAIKRLENELVEFTTLAAPMPTGEYEMLSLMVNEAVNGIDISKRYPVFYKELLNNSDLREAFLDSLELIEQSNKNELAPLPALHELNLDFLKETSHHSTAKNLGKNSWRVSWQRTIEQLQSVFTPQELAYRSDPSLFDDPWFTVLRDEFEIEKILFTIVLECAVSKEAKESLSCALNIAINSDIIPDWLRTKAQVSLNWGKYNQNLSISKQGRFRFPDIPFVLIFDKRQQNIRSALKLSFETFPSA